MAVVQRSIPINPATNNTGDTANQLTTTPPDSEQGEYEIYGDALFRTKSMVDLSGEAHRCHDNWLERENEAEARHDPEHLAVARNTIAREREEFREEVAQRREWYRKRRSDICGRWAGHEVRSQQSTPPYSDPRWDVTPLRDEYEVHTPSALTEADLNADYKLRT